MKFLEELEFALLHRLNLEYHPYLDKLFQEMMSYKSDKLFQEQRLQEQKWDLRYFHSNPSLQTLYLLEASAYHSQSA